MGSTESESIQIFSRGRATPNQAPLTAMICYKYMCDDGPLQIGGLTRINLNEELIRLGYGSNFLSTVSLGLAPTRNTLTAWKPFELPLTDAFWGKVTWVNLEGESEY